MDRISTAKKKIQEIQFIPHLVKVVFMFGDVLTNLLNGCQLIYHGDTLGLMFGITTFCVVLLPGSAYQKCSCTWWSLIVGGIWSLFSYSDKPDEIDLRRDFLQLKPHETVLEGGVQAVLVLYVIMLMPGQVSWITLTSLWFSIVSTILSSVDQVVTKELKGENKLLLAGKLLGAVTIPDCLTVLVVAYPTINSVGNYLSKSSCFVINATYLSGDTDNFSADVHIDNNITSLFSSPYYGNDTTSLSSNSNTTDLSGSGCYDIDTQLTLFLLIVMHVLCGIWSLAGLLLMYISDPRKNSLVNHLDEIRKIQTSENSKEEILMKTEEYLPADLFWSIKIKSNRIAFIVFTIFSNMILVSMNSAAIWWFEAGQANDSQIIILCCFLFIRILAIILNIIYLVKKTLIIKIRPAFIKFIELEEVIERIRISTIDLEQQNGEHLLQSVRTKFCDFLEILHFSGITAIDKQSFILQLDETIQTLRSLIDANETIENTISRLKCIILDLESLHGERCDYKDDFYVKFKDVMQRLHDVKKESENDPETNPELDRFL